ncbi:MAG: VCBS repeat-containing protein, partial [Candidatus Bipolaricaulota bacterium]
VPGNGAPSPSLVLSGEPEGIAVAPLTAALEIAGPLREVIPTGRVRDAALCDIDGDGEQDLVATVDRGIAVVPTDERWSPPASMTEIEGLSTFAVGTMDGDDLPDIAAIRSGRSEIVLLPGRTARAGEGAVVCFAADDEPTEILAADFDGNGRSDLVLASPSSLRVWMNGGVPRGVSRLALDRALLLAVGDLDSDGDADIVTDHPGGLAVLTNDGAGGLTRSVLPLPGADAVLAAAITDEILWLLVRPHGGDAGNDLRRPLALAVSADGVVRSSAVVPEDALPLLRVGDLDGDGLPEAFGATSDGLWVLWEHGLRRYPLEGAVSLPVAADVDGDGQDEVAVILTDSWAELVLVELCPSEASAGAPLVRLEALPMAITVADVDSVPGEEIVLVAARLSLDLGVEAPALRPAGWKLIVAAASDRCRVTELDRSTEGALPWVPDGVAVGDFDDDGEADAAIGTVNGDALRIVHGLTRDGTSTQYLPVPIGPVAAADLDGGGCDEILGLCHGGRSRLWIRWNGGVR